MADESNSGEYRTFKHIPFSVLIGGPLDACIDAQTYAAQTTWQYMREVSLETDSDGELHTVTVDFTYVIGGQLMQISLPLLTLVPIPFFSVSTLDIEFNANITDYEGEFYAKYAGFASSEGHQKLESESQLNVKLHASQDHMPVGLSKLLNILDECISTEPLLPVVLPELRLQPETLRLEVGQTLTIQSYVNGESTVGDQLVWAVTAPEVISINKEGRVKALSVGLGVIIAERQSVVATCHVEVLKKHVKDTSSYRSAETGQYVTHAYAQENPETTVSHKQKGQSLSGKNLSSKSSSGARYRCAKTGRFVSKENTRSEASTTIAENTRVRSPRRSKKS